jgi:hypothetical protein
MAGIEQNQKLARVEGGILGRCRFGPVGGSSGSNQPKYSRQRDGKCCDAASSAFLSLLQITELANFLDSPVVEFRNRLEGRLPHLLLLVAASEMVVYRLLVPGLRPRIDAEPPLWHSLLTYLGLFLFYFASALAVGVVAHQLWQIVRRRESHAKVLTFLVVPAGVVFLALACMSIVAAPSAGVTFLLEGSVVLAIVAIVLAQLTQKGDLGVRIGLVLLALPLVVHFYAPLSVRYIGGEEAQWNGLTDQVENAGRWLVLLAALTMPYCFGARPFFLRAARLAPLLVAVTVGVSGVLLIRNDYVKGMELAQNGLGFSVGPAAPSSLVALSLLALSAVAWTLASCFTVASRSRRLIGVGIALVVVGGYGFAWPLQFLVGLAGLLSISKAATTVQTEERAEMATLAALSVPPIRDDHWQPYIESLLEALRGEAASGEQGAVVTIRGQSGQQRTHFVYKRDEMTVTVTVERVAGAINGIDVHCSVAEEEPTEQGAPEWTLHAHHEVSSLGIVHPAPPDCPGDSYRSEIAGFDTCFQLRDTGGWSEALIDDEIGERMVKEVHGWIACWSDGSLRFQVYPGRAAPLDSPIPITALSFQSGDMSTEPMVSLLDLLVELGQRANQHAADKRNEDASEA